MSDSIFMYREPKNEPVLSYAPGTKERAKLKEAVEKISGEVVEIPLIIGGKEVKTGDMGEIVMPHDHKHVLARYHKAGPREVQMAIDAALEARSQWRKTPWTLRTSVMMRIAELFAHKYRYLINAATMMNQSKSPYQAEIDSACEAIDFLRFNAYFASQIYAQQPISEPGIINRLDYRPLEGFVYAVTPFNFTAISTNLPLSPAVMGNTVVWKPATVSLLSSYHAMKIFMEAGLPAGVVNFIPGPGEVSSRETLSHPDLAGIHFTGSTAVFRQLWKTVGENIARYKSYPRLVGETGGKDFVFVHSSADTRAVAVALVRGAFEYQGQKCSAASRAYLPKSLWNEIRTEMEKILAKIKVGDPRDFTTYVNAVIDEKSFDNCMKYIEYAKASSDAEIIFGGTGDKSVGYFVNPTVILTADPHFKSMEEEIFGPVLTICLYEDDEYEKTLKLCDKTSPYGLTGSIFAKDASALKKAMKKLRYAAGNFYINDKPTGAVVGCQPFGGSRASGTNDKAGSQMNLMRWVSPRNIKENLLPPSCYWYPYLNEEE